MVFVLHEAPVAWYGFVKIHRGDTIYYSTGQVHRSNFPLYLLI